MTDLANAADEKTGAPYFQIVTLPSGQTGIGSTELYVETIAAEFGLLYTKTPR